MAEISFAPSHIGICVSDLDPAMRFYCDGLGFEKTRVLRVGQEFAATLEVAGPIECVSQFLHRHEMTIELLYYPSPGVVGQPSQHRNQLGITHLSFYVDDIERAAAQVVACGGTLLSATRHGAGDPSVLDIVFLADPDGTRVELMQVPAG